MAGKLTPKQHALLVRIGREGWVAARPRRGTSAAALYLAGFAEWDDQAGRGTYWLKITEAGLAALKAQPMEGE